MLAAVLFCSPRLVGQATTIVALRTSTEIIIAADSRVTLGKDSWPSPAPVCKITQIGNVVIAGAGFVELRGTNYDIKSIAVRAFGERAKFTDKVDRFTSYLGSWMKETLNAMREMTETKLPDSEIPQERAEIIFATVENGIPMMVRRDFVPEVLPDRSIRIIVVEWDCLAECVDPITRYGIGIHPNIDAFTAKHPNFLQTLSLRESARFLVLLEAVNFPAFVGEPIDIVHLDKTGVQWIQRKAECEKKNRAQPGRKRRR